MTDAGLRAEGHMERIARRALDVGVSTATLALLSPLLLIIAAMVKRSSPGPVFFAQERVGRDGRPFRLYKFRSMRVSTGGPEVTSGTDNRITAIGRLLRKTKLDELPQFLNVLRGEMSLVGPRPEVPRYVAHYSPQQRYVLSVRPGITGLCQLEFVDEEALLAGRDDVEEFYLKEVMPRKLEIDHRYICERTIAGDVGILFRTLATILGMSGRRRQRGGPHLPPRAA